MQASQLPYHIKRIAGEANSKEAVEREREKIAPRENGTLVIDFPLLLLLLCQRGGGKNKKKESRGKAEGKLKELKRREKSRRLQGKKKQTFAGHCNRKKPP